MQKHGTVALLVRWDGKEPSLHEVVSDSEEVEFLERIARRNELPLSAALLEFRAFRDEQSERFGDYVESLVSSPGVREEVKKHGIQWLRSKMNMDHFDAQEREAAQVIARFAFQVFGTDPTRDDFWLEGPSARVRIRVFSFTEDAKAERETA